MDNIFNGLSIFFHYIRNSGIDVMESWSNTEFLSLSERLLKRNVPLLSEKWNITIKDEELKLFNLSGAAICWSYTNEENQFQ